MLAVSLLWASMVRHALTASTTTTLRAALLELARTLDLAFRTMTGPSSIVVATAKIVTAMRALGLPTTRALSSSQVLVALACTLTTLT
jgi:hypothetical protein